MTYRPKSGETEFGGVDGMYPDENLLAPTEEQEVWATYATNEGGGGDAAGEDTAAEEWGRTHIGEPRQSFSIPEKEPNLTLVHEWNPAIEQSGVEDA